MKSKVYLAFINDYFPPGWKHLTTKLRQCIHFPFDYQTVQIDLSLFYSSERNQYHSTLILSQLLKFLPEDGLKIVGITNVDIFIPIFTFVFGEAQLNGPGAIVSGHRLENKFYGLPADNSLFYERIHKEVVHELGHTMGLVHCPNFECAMHSTTYVEEIDLKLPVLCKECQQILGVTCED